MVFGGENFHIFYDFFIKSDDFCNEKRKKVVWFDKLSTCFDEFEKKFSVNMGCIDKMSGTAVISEKVNSEKLMNNGLGEDSI